MSERKIWLLKLILPGRFGKLLTGILLFSILLPFFFLGAGDSLQDSPPAWFFSLVIAYIIPVFGHITEKSREALSQLHTQLDLDDQAYVQKMHSLDSASTATVVFQLCWGAIMGFVHMSFVAGSAAAAVEGILTSTAGLMSMLGALLVWMIMTTVIDMLIRQASMFAQLGRDNVAISFLNTRKLLPFARVSISSSLAILGALALFPLIGVESGLDLMEIVPGAVALMIPLIIIFIMPVWPIHRRLAAIKEQELSSVNDSIENYLNKDGVIDIAAQMNPQLTALLGYRREVLEISTWPFDLGNVSKLALYLIIPPLTWVAAALIENVVDSVI